MKKFSEFVREDVHPKILGALKAAPPHVLDNVLSARDSVDTSPNTKGSGLQPDQTPSKGSSRAVLHVKNDHQAVVDGRPTALKGVVKMAHDGHIARGGSNEGKLTGQIQNKVEASKKIQKFATLVRDGSGKGHFKTNPHGVVPPVFAHGNDHAFIHIGHADSITHAEFSKLTVTKNHPDGLDLGYMRHMTDPKLDKYDKQRFKHEMTHPLVKKFAAFRKATGVSDMHTSNFGVWTHPHTGEKHVVLRDAGFDPSVAKHYGWDHEAEESKARPQVTKSMGFKAKVPKVKAPVVPSDQGAFKLKGGKAKRPKDGLKLRAATAAVDSFKEKLNRGPELGTKTKYKNAMADKRAAQAAAKLPNEIGSNTYNGIVNRHINADLQPQSKRVGFATYQAAGRAKGRQDERLGKEAEKRVPDKIGSKTLDSFRKNRQAGKIGKHTMNAVLNKYYKE
jgi:hypothetical protein